MNLNRTESFSFKKVAYDKFMASLDESVTEDFIAQHYELLREDEKNKEKITAVRRKPVTINFSLPESINLLPEEDQKAYAEILHIALAGYCKDKFVDNFQEVGSHTLSDYMEALAQRGTRSINFEFTDSDKEIAVAKFQAFMASALDSVAAGEIFGTVAQKNFTENAIAKYVKAYSAEVLEKLMARLDAWAEYISAEDDLPDGVVNVYFKWKSNLSTQHKNLSLNVADLL